MIIFLYGSDSYRLKQAKEDLISRYQAKYNSGVNLFSFDFSEVNDLNGVDDALRISSFFNEHKLIICRNLFSKKPTADKMAPYLKDHKISDYSDATLMVVENLSEKDLILKHKELFTLLSSKENTIKTVNSLEGVELVKWVENEFQIRGCSIKSDVLKKLIEIVGNNSWLLVNEVNKLTNYQNGGEVKTEHINLLVSQSAELNIFDLIDAVAQKNKPKAYSLLYQELKSSRDPYYILTMIIYQFRNLLTVKDLKKLGHFESEISHKSKLHPFVVKKALKSPFEIAGAVKIYGQLLALDTGFKTSKFNLEDSLYGLVFSPTA